MLLRLAEPKISVGVELKNDIAITKALKEFSLPHSRSYVPHAPAQLAWSFHFS